MKTIIAFCTAVLCSAVLYAQGTTGKIPITFYYSEHCVHCIKVKNEVIPVLEKKYADTVTIVRKHNAEEKVYKEFLALCSQYHVDPFVPALYVVLSPSEKYLLVGVDNIELNVFKLLDGFLAEQRKK